MPIAAVLLVLSSSIFHVAWNSLVKTSGDPLMTSTRAVSLGVLAVSPAALVAWLATGRPTLSPEGWLQPAPWTEAWGLRTEPFVAVIDEAGLVRAKFEGALTVEEIEAVLAAL